MSVKVGIPRALFYYYLFPFWKAFFEYLGAEVVVSPPTNKQILNIGVKTSVDEACLPVKVYYGHVISLRDRVDLLFLPRLVSIEKKAYICPKFMGLPDMIRSTLSGLPPIIDVNFNAVKGHRAYKKTVLKLGSNFCSSLRKINRAWVEAVRHQKEFEELQTYGFSPIEALRVLQEGRKEKKKKKIFDFSHEIAVLGHGYTIYDDFLSLNTIKHLNDLGAKISTAENLPINLLEEKAEKLPKRMFWTMGKRILGAALHYLESSQIDGFVYVTVFGCGPDSVIADLTERYARRRGMPFILITLDEHSGEAGVITRLEAFVDMLARRGKHENYFSSYGKSVDICQSTS
ncbi:MAG TPA: hypothetical protein DEA47_03835 [Peptococcaceae bacterium]|nr:MAG: hypothetical protein XD50_0934 [Clostridia bacterium 41_269]HBT20482.1 hypothetical protein [Peptococcaceae bacterium]